MAVPGHARVPVSASPDTARPACTTGSAGATRPRPKQPTRRDFRSAGPCAILRLRHQDGVTAHATGRPHTGHPHGASTRTPTHRASTPGLTPEPSEDANGPLTPRRPRTTSPGPAESEQPVLLAVATVAGSLIAVWLLLGVLVELIVRHVAPEALHARPLHK